MKIALAYGTVVICDTRVGNLLPVVVVIVVIACSMLCWERDFKFCQKFSQIHIKFDFVINNSFSAAVVRFGKKDLPSSFVTGSRNKASDANLIQFVNNSNGIVITISISVGSEELFHFLNYRQLTNRNLDRPITLAKNDSTDYFIKFLKIECQPTFLVAQIPWITLLMRRAFVIFNWIRELEQILRLALNTSPL